MNFSQVVSAEVTQVSKTLYIQPNFNFDYTTSLNIVNKSNINYTNTELLIEPFILDSGIDGGFSGSFLPPAKFQLNDATSSSTNDHLILSSIVEFNRKNLLSGSSVSWWRCPYFYNSSIPASRDWGLTLSIYHLNTPRTANLSFEYAGGISNYPVVPTLHSDPSLIFTKTYSDCGQTQNDNQWNFTRFGKLPLNETLLDPDLPLQTDSLEPDYNPYMWMIDNSYNITIDYSMAWFNVTAPIYPGEAYMVIWDIIDSTTSPNEAGSFWLTASDIGNNYYGKTLVSWNDRDIFEIPLDLDSSVIFQVGMGSGVTGEKLQDNIVGYNDHTAFLSNPSFESTTFKFQRDFSSSFAVEGWHTNINGICSISHNSASGRAEFDFDETGSLTSGSSGISGDLGITWAEMYYDFLTLWGTDGENAKFDITMNPIEVVDTFGSGTAFTSSLMVGLFSTTGEHSRIIIKRWAFVDAVTEVVTYDHKVGVFNSGGTWDYYPIPYEIFPTNFYLSLQSDTVTGNTIVHMYDHNNPNKIWFSCMAPSSYTGTTSIDGIYFAGAIEASTLNTDVVQDGLVAIAIDKLSVTERGDSSWSYYGGADILWSKNNFWDGFETVVPGYDGIPATLNEQALAVTHRGTGAVQAWVQQSIPVAFFDKRVFATAYYRMQNNIPSDTFITIGLSGWDGSWHSVSDSYYVRDVAWHQVSTGHLVGSFSQVRITISAWFPANSPADLNMAFFDDINIFSIDNLPKNTHEFYQEVDHTEFNAINYYSFMFPIKHAIAPDFPPYCRLDFRNSVGTIMLTKYTMPTDFYDDFIMWGIPTSDIDPAVTDVKITLINYCEDAYIFMYDRNSDFNFNDEFNTDYNYMKDVDTTSTTVKETFYSPFYSLRATEGQWINADSDFTTTYFYYVTVRFVTFRDNDVEIVSIEFHTIDVGNLEMFTMNLKSFGNVYNDAEWLAYLELRNRPDFWDVVSDWFVLLSGIGIWQYTIGKFIYKVIEFLTPLVEDLINLILEVVVLVISLIIYFLSVWIMWKFVRFWILIAEGKTEEAIMEFQSVTSSITGAVTGIATKVSSGGSRGKGGRLRGK